LKEVAMSGMLLLMAALSMPWDSKPGDKDAPLSWMTDANEVVIQDHWVGYGPASPVVADYTLRRKDGNFVGGASFSVGGHFKKARKDSCDVEIPAGAAAEFLKSLAGCVSREAEYKPGIHHTDDYPDIRITVKTEGKTATFSSRSQGEFHAPWAVEAGGKTRVVDGDAPGRALKRLEKHLAKGRLEALVKQVVAQPAGGDRMR